MNKYKEYEFEMKNANKGEEATAFMLEKANNGDMEAMEILCDAYYYGNWGIKDYSLSLYWGNKANEKGSKQVKEILGIQYLNGYGVEKDPKIALEYLSDAIEANCVKAARFVGLYWQSEQDFEKAKYYFEVGAIRGDITSKIYLAECYEKGLGCQADMSLAIEWYKSAAKRKDRIGQPAIDALNRLGINIE